MKIDFYNIEKRNFESSICQILQKAYATGEQILIKVSDKDKQDTIDKMLWEFDAKSWLPHGTTEPTLQPIFITTDIGKKNNASILIIIDGSEIPDAGNFTRCLYVFNGNNKEILDIARTRYKQLLAKNYELQYHNL